MAEPCHHEHHRVDTNIIALDDGVLYSPSELTLLGPLPDLTQQA